MYRITIFINQRVLNRGQIKKSAVFFWTDLTPAPACSRQAIGAFPLSFGEGSVRKKKNKKTEQFKKF
jgi:hypothetical protein